MHVRYDIYIYIRKSYVICIHTCLVEELLPKLQEELAPVEAAETKVQEICAEVLETLKVWEKRSI